MNPTPRRDWLAQAEQALLDGRAITIRPTGSSMRPRIEPGDAVTLRPTRRDEIAVGDIVLARVRRRRALLVLHQVLAIEGGQFLLATRAGARTVGWRRAMLWAWRLKSSAQVLEPRLA